MLKTTLVALLPLLFFFSNGSDRSFTGLNSQGRSGNTETLEKMIVASGNVAMDLNLSRLNGTRGGKAGVGELRFEAERDSFFKVLVLNGEFERDIAYEVLNDFLANGKQVAFDAVFAGDDDAAIGVLKALHRHGFRIPEDVAVIGFDDLGFAPFLNPPLTTVRAPTESVGRIATERLFSLLENQPSEEAVVLPTEIIFRRSCGCEHETQIL